MQARISLKRIIDICKACYNSLDQLIDSGLVSDARTAVTTSLLCVR